MLVALIVIWPSFAEAGVRKYVDYDISDAKPAWIWLGGHLGLSLPIHTLSDSRSLGHSTQITDMLRGSPRCYTSTISEI